MSELNEDIDKLFRDSIEESEITPSKGVWESIDKKLDRKQFNKFQKRLRRLIGLIIFLSISVIGLGVLQVSQYFSKKDNQISTIETKENVNAEALVNSKTFTAKQNSSVKSSGTSPTSTDKKINHEKNNNNTVNTLVNKTENKKPDFESGISANKSYKQNYNNVSASFTSNVSNESLIAEAETNEIAKTILPEIQTTDILNVDTAENMNKNQDSLMAGIDKDSVQTLQNTSPDIEDKMPFKYRFSIAGIFSPDFYSSQFLDNDHNDNQQEGDYKDSESPDFSYTTGIKIGCKVSKRWGIYSGLTFSAMSYSINQKTLYAQQADNGEVNYLVTSSAGVVRLPASSLTQIGDSINTNGNIIQSLQFISIPLLFQYRISNKRMDYYAFAGANANFFLLGKTEATFENSVSESSTQIDGMRKNYFTGVVGLGAQYHISPRVSVMLEPTFKKAITSINKSTPVSSYPFSFGITAGLSFHF